MGAMAGYPLDMNSVNQRAGRVVTNVRDALDDAAAFNAALQDTTVLGKPDPNDPATDQLAVIGFQPVEITNMRNGIFALSLLTMVAHGQAPLPNASDFFFFAKHLAGAQW